MENGGRGGDCVDDSLITGKTGSIMQEMPMTAMEWRMMHREHRPPTAAVLGSEGIFQPGELAA